MLQARQNVINEAQLTRWPQATRQRSQVPEPVRALLTMCTLQTLRCRMGFFSLHPARRVLTRRDAIR